MNIKTKLLLALCLLISSSLEAKPVEVHATAATPLPPVASDVMDDPAIWINKSTPSESLIFGTNKRPPFGGLSVYKLSGHLKEVISVGPLNNVDTRTNFRFEWHFIDLAVASHTEIKKLAFFGIEPNQGKITFLGFSPISFERTPYGLCLAKKDKDFFAIVTFKGGGAEKWQFWEELGKLHMKKIAAYPIKTQAEGCVVNDEDGRLFIAEEEKGIWVFNEGTPPHMIAKVREHDLVADLEGLTLYQGKYLIVSSQGNSTYSVFSAKPPYPYLGHFAITPSSTQEGTEETDGIAVTSANLGGAYAKGLFVAHDNRSSKGGGSNFKFIPWSEIAQRLRLE